MLWRSLMVAKVVRTGMEKVVLEEEEAAEQRLDMTIEHSVMNAPGTVDKMPVTHAKERVVEVEVLGGRVGIAGTLVAMLVDGISPIPHHHRGCRRNGYIRASGVDGRGMRLAFAARRISFLVSAVYAGRSDTKGSTVYVDVPKRTLWECRLSSSRSWRHLHSSSRGCSNSNINSLYNSSKSTHNNCSSTWFRETLEQGGLHLATTLAPVCQRRACLSLATGRWRPSDPIFSRQSASCRWRGRVYELQTRELQFTAQVTRATCIT